MDYEEVPIKFDRTVNDDSYDTRKLEFTKKDKTIRVKQEFPIYDSQENLEILCRLIKMYDRSITDYDLLNLLGAAEVYDRFRQCLGGDALDTWDNIVVDKKETDWKKYLAELVQFLIGPRACDIQKMYLHETKKPSKMTMRGYALRLKAINSYLPILGLKQKQKGLTEEDLVKIITKNIPKDIRIDFIVAKGDQIGTVAEALHLLVLLEIKNKKNGNQGQGRDNDRVSNRKKRNGNRDSRRNKNKNKNKNKGSKTPCKLPGHSGHDWADCFYNPNG